MDKYAEALRDADQSLFDLACNQAFRLVVDADWDSELRQVVYSGSLSWEGDQVG